MDVFYNIYYAVVSQSQPHPLIYTLFVMLELGFCNLLRFLFASCSVRLYHERVLEGDWKARSVQETCSSAAPCASR